MTARTAWTAGCHWRCRHCSRVIPRQPSRRRRNCMRARSARTCSSRSRVRRAGIAAIEESIFAGVPVNVTLLFSREQYLAAADAYMRGIERRIAAGLDPKVASVASLFVSRWDVAIHDRVPQHLRNRLGIAIARRTYKAYRGLLASARWKSLARSRCADAAPALGQHRHQGPRGSGYPVRRGAGRAEYHQHAAGKDPAGFRRARQGAGCAAA